ncbi:MAG: family 16 glycosylhydrolase [Kofleriaceae bacterium]|nr:family 16 glycosylhydrolase [Kofleriaceae bacterium]
MKRRGLLLVVLALCLFIAGVLWAPHPRIGVEGASCVLLEHDDLPWNRATKKNHEYCQVDAPMQFTRRTGSFETLRDDDLGNIDASYWDELDTTFPCNNAIFSSENVVSRSEGGISLRLEPSDNEKGFSSGSIATKGGEKFTYGRFEAELKAAKGSGLITAFFLYRFDPWQEIDVEILGKDTSKILLNVFFNPGEPGDLYNYGLRGTPVVIDLGFDASLDFHRYAIEWEPDEIRWFVDDRLIHVRHDGGPTPIPHLPMRFHVNLWPCCSTELAGPFDTAALPLSADFQSITISSWKPSLGSRIKNSVFDYFSSSDKVEDWRDDAGWIKP